jgi:3-isopropylmalate/(R)-2-methylmalate dehydratase small subunit
LDERQTCRLADTVIAAPDPIATVDLVRCTVTSPQGDEVSFKLAEDRRMSLIEGLDETSFILRHEHEIDAYQARLRIEQPWVFIGEGGRARN